MNEESLSEDSVTQIIVALKDGAEGEPQEQIVARFLHRLEALARTRLGSPGRHEEAEDVALSAIKSFLTRIPRNEFPHVTSRNSLWGLLAAITLNKAASSRRKQLAKKRDVRREVSLQGLEAAEPSYEFLDSMMTEGNRVLDALPDQICRQVAQLRLEGYTLNEIAERIGRSESTVERKLQLVRKVLRAELDIES